MVEYSIELIYYSKQRTPEDLLNLKFKQIYSWEKVFSDLNFQEIMVLCLRFGLIGLDPSKIKPTELKYFKNTNKYKNTQTVISSKTTGIFS